jgi:hypothetical protein
MSPRDRAGVDVFDLTGDRFPVEPTRGDLAGRAKRGAALRVADEVA